MLNCLQLGELSYYITYTLYIVYTMVHTYISGYWPLPCLYSMSVGTNAWQTDELIVSWKERTYNAIIKKLQQPLHGWIYDYAGKECEKSYKKPIKYDSCTYSTSGVGIHTCTESRKTSTSILILFAEDNDNIACVSGRYKTNVLQQYYRRLFARIIDTVYASRISMYLFTNWFTAT